MFVIVVNINGQATNSAITSDVCQLKAFNSRGL